MLAEVSLMSTVKIDLEEGLASLLHPQSHILLEHSPEKRRLNFD